MDARPTFEAVLAAFGVEAEVTVPGGTPVGTRVAWMPPVSVEAPAGEAFRRVEARRVVAVPKSAVPQLPRGTVVFAPEEQGGTPSAWSVDEVQRVYSDHYRATVVPGIEAT